MANVDAFDSGFDAGLGKKQKPKGKLKNDGGDKGPIDPPVAAANQSVPEGFKKGGKVRRTGKALVHRGEYVLTAKQAKKYTKKSGKRKRVSGKR